MKHKQFFAVSSALTLALTFGVQGAQALVWTDLADYAPGSVVTIHGDGSDGAAYLEGEAVTVDVLGPNGYTASCTDDAVENGSWSCDITLWDSMDAVGSYSYTAIGSQSGTIEYGTFTDAPDPALVTFNITQSGLTSGTLSLPIVMTYKPATGTDQTETHSVTNSAGYTLAVKKNTNVTYSGFATSVVVGAQTCTRNAGQAASGVLAIGTADTTTSVAYTCAATVLPDSTPPVITRTLTGTLGTNNWYTSNVFVDWTVTDAQSAVVIDAGCVDETLTAETAGTTPICTAHSVGGSASSSVTVKIDKTGPTAALAVTSGTPGLHDWYISDVTISASGADSMSEPVVCTGDQYQTEDTSGTSFSGSCTNDAGLTTTATPLTVKVSKHGPSAMLTVTDGTPGAHDWYVSNVTITTVGSDPIASPVTCNDDQYQTEETKGTTFHGSCTNDAGRTTYADDLIIKLDKTGPSAQLDVTAGTPGAHGWYTSDVTITTSGSDDMSDVICTADQTLTTETTGLDFDGQCVNDAGLSTDAEPITIKLDKTAPQVSLSADGNTGTSPWFIGDVTITTNGVDGVSGIDFCTDPQVQSTETTGTAYNGSCTDMAGNSANATPITVQLDKTGPVITWDSGAPADGGSYYYGDLPSTMACTAVDGISLVTAAGCKVTGYGTDTGTFTAVATAANFAGIVTTETRTYTVLPWTLRGFFAPVDMRFVWNVVKAGSTVPLKFEVFKGSTELTSKGQIVFGPSDGFTVVKDPLGAPPTVTGVPISTSLLTSGKTQLRYDITSGQFIQNWQTPKAPGFYKVTLTTRDGSTLVAWFQLK